MEKNKKFQELIHEREIPELNPDFEETMMKRIYQAETSRNNGWNQIRYINLMFAIVFLLAMAIMITIVKSDFSIHLFQFTISRMYMQLPLAVAVLFCAGIAYKATLYKMGRLDILEL